MQKKKNRPDARTMRRLMEKDEECPFLDYVFEKLLEKEGEDVFGVGLIFDRSQFHSNEFSVARYALEQLGYVVTVTTLDRNYLESYNLLHYLGDNTYTHHIAVEVPPIPKFAED